MTGSSGHKTELHAHTNPAGLVSGLRASFQPFKMMLESLLLQGLFKEEFPCIRFFQPVPESRITPSLTFINGCGLS